MATRKRPASGRGETPRRFRSARIDARVKSILDDIEATYGLPNGSVRLVHKNGAAVRKDSSIKSFLDKWGWPY